VIIGGLLLLRWVGWFRSAGPKACKGSSSGRVIQPAAGRDSRSGTMAAASLNSDRGATPHQGDGEIGMSSAYPFAVGDCRRARVIAAACGLKRVIYSTTGLALLAGTG